jgi:multicomponent Na+:H+ antiporter subunit B
MRLDVILRVVTKLVLPFMLLFALYVQFHGEYGPGGGFQAGVVAAGMIILYALIFGISRAKLIVPQSLVEIMVPLGVLIYAGTGVLTMFLGQNFLDYGVLSQTPAVGRVRGIILVELGVLVTVFSTMIAIFYALVERGR